MFGGLDNKRPLVDRAWIVHRDDKEWCLRDGRGGLSRGRDVVRGHWLFSLDEDVSESNGKGERTYLDGRNIYRLSVVDRNDRSGRDVGYRGGNLFIDRRGRLLLVNNRGFVLGLCGNLDAALFSRLRRGG